MITEAFDNVSEAVISPFSFLGEKKQLCDIAVATFSREIYSAVLEQFPNEQVGEISAANRIKPIHMLQVGNRNIIFYLSEIGSALAGTDLTEVNWLTGADKFIIFGSAGSLDKSKTTGKYVIPSSAYREEGMSYHYAPAADYIDIPNADMLFKLFEELGLPCVKGKVWTTDAIYRETRNLVEKRKAEGCLAVEMELAGVQAVCDYYGFQLYDFLVTGDVVDQPDYTPDGIYDANHNMDKFYVAMEIANRLS